MTIERPGDVCAPGADMTEARRRAAVADKLGSRRDGLRWRPISYEVLVDNRKQGPGRPESAEVVAGITAADGVLLKTSVYGSIVVTEWRHHPHPTPTCYHVFELDRFDDTEQTFAVEQGADADALSYHAELESAIRERRRVSREIRRRRRNGHVLGELLREYSAAEVVEALGVLQVADALGVRPLEDQLTEP